LNDPNLTMKSKDPVWGFYTVTVNGKKTTAICNDCKNEVSAKAGDSR